MINLHLKTAVSFDSIVNVDDLENIDQDVVCVINPNLIDTPSLYNKCKELKKKLIVGLELGVLFGTYDKPITVNRRRFGKVVLIAKNKNGYRNLCILASIANRNLVNEQPCLDLETTNLYSNDLICLLDCFQSPISIYARSGNESEILVEILQYKTIFGEDLYCEVFEEDLNTRLQDFYKKHKIKCVASNMVSYLKEEDEFLYKCLWGINNNASVDAYDVDQDRAYKKVLPHPQVMINNLHELVNRVGDIELEYKDIKLPDIKTTNDEFIQLLTSELKNRNIHTPEYISRLDYELGTIIKYGYVHYFMLVYKLIKYCNDNLGGYYSAGRGSVGGSLVAYLLGIIRTDPVNPAGFDIQIPFDRFLNSGRKVMPDIDMDFLPKDRQPVIEYLYDVYGSNNVKHMLTVTKLKCRSAIRDLARITGKLTPEIDKIIKSFPSDQQLTMEMIKESAIYKQNQDNNDFIWLFDLAERLIGYPKGVGVHASGIALCAESMYGVIPFIVHPTSGKECCQYNQHDLEQFGILKLDVLGLTTLQVMKDCLDMVNERIEFKLEDVDIEDSEVYDFINNGDITGVFQFDTHNYRKVISQVKPYTFKELVDLNTLGRAALLISGITDMYIRRKEGSELVEPLHPTLKGLMKQTYELPLYQEQIMDIFVHMAGYSMSEADDVRKAIGKKKIKIMAEQKKIFIARCKERGYDEEAVNYIWSAIEKFSKYTWNLGHAITYTRVCYETAYLSFHFPVEFICACIKNNSTPFMIGQYLSVLKKRRIEVKRIDINKSVIEYIPAPDGKSVQAGFSNLKQWKTCTNKFLAIREVGGEFKNCKDFCERVPKNIINKTALKSLYCAGAFMDFEDKDLVLDRIGITKEDETNLLMDQYKNSGFVSLDVNSFMDEQLELISNLKSKNKIAMYAYVVDIHEIYDKNKNKMAFLKLEDCYGRYDTICFASVWNNQVSKNDLVKVGISYSNGFVIDFIWKLDPKEKAPNKIAVK